MKNIIRNIKGGSHTLDEFLEKILRFAFSISKFRADFISGKGLWCAHCHKGGKNMRKMHAHHVEPIKTRKDYSSWDEYIAAVFTTNLQCLCPSCHSKHHGKSKKKGLSP